MCQNAAKMDWQSAKAGKRRIAIISELHTKTGKKNRHISELHIFMCQNAAKMDWQSAKAGKRRIAIISELQKKTGSEHYHSFLCLQTMSILLCRLPYKSRKVCT
jgi:predicted transcriptional regulator